MMLEDFSKVELKWVIDARNAAIEELNGCNSKIINHYKTIAEFSTLDKEMYEAIAKLLSIRENETVKFKRYNGDYTAYQKFEGEGWYLPISTTELDEYSIGSNPIIELFYELRSEDLEKNNFEMNDILKPLVDFGDMNYAKDFIDYVIIYRLKENQKFTSKEELEKLLNEFIKHYDFENKKMDANVLSRK